MKKFIRIGVDLEFFSAACAGKRRRPAEDAQTEPPGDAQVLFRDRPCFVGIKACASSPYWARELLAMGHEVRLIPPIYVRPYVKRGKNDALEAEIAAAHAASEMSRLLIEVPGIKRATGT
jgi:transposase